MQPQYKLATLFSQVAATYELTNHLLTFGLDVYWRRRAAALARMAKNGVWLDVCTGTGDMAKALSSVANSGTIILAMDFCSPMLTLTKKKKSFLVKPIMAEASSLPLPDEAVDVITLTFATRNLNHSAGSLVKYFQEFYRVLRPGGFFLNLETSQPKYAFLRSLFHIYVRTTVKRVGRWLSGSSSAYAYLASSITHFFTAEELTRLLHRARFSRVKFFPMAGGIVALHVAFK